jgi:CBS domain-containing protein
MSTEIVEVREFLGRHHPFDLLPPTTLGVAANAVEVAYVRKGGVIAKPGARLDHLYMVRSGAVESHSPDGHLLSRMGEGECFGVRALLRGGTTVNRTFAIEDSLLYLLPAPVFESLRRDHPAFAYFFAAFAGGPLGASIDSALGGKTFDMLSRRVGDLIVRGPVTVSAGATIRAAAQVMRDHRVSAALVMEGETLVGILTDRDLRGKVVAAGVSPDDGVASVMSPAPKHVQASDLAFEALLLMSRHDIHHLPVLDDGRLVGCLTASTVVAAQTDSPLYLARAIHGATAATDLPRLVARLPQVIGHMVEAGASAHGIGQIATTITDAVTHALIRLAEAELGPPPVPYAWLAAGSQGRQEQTAVSDQDNCLILADTYDPARHGDYFAALAHFVTDGLDASGYVYCPGEMMARTPAWRQPLGVWKRYFREWIEEPEPKALMLSCIFFDLRFVAGTAALWEELQRDILEKTERNRIFLAHMAANAMKHEPPIGFFRGFVLSYGGLQDHTFDLKHNGVVPIVDLARVHALSAGVGAVNTQDRLAAAAEAKAISQQGAMDLKDALEFIGITRLKHQSRQIRDGQPADNLLMPKELSSFERGNLKSAFQVVKDMQASLASVYQLSRF